MLLEDMWCKYILGSEKYTRPLEIILENVLQKEPFSLQGKLSEITFERPVSKIMYDTKNSRTDLTVLLKDEKTLINVEAYTYFSLESFKKSNLYILRGYSSQLKKGHKYQTMNPFIQINLVDHVEANLLQDKIIQRYRLEEQGYPLTDDIQIYYIRLDLLDKLNYNEGISDKEFLNILHFLKAKTEDERKKLIKESEVIRKMDEVVKDFLTDEVMNEERSILNKSNRLARETGIKQGLEQGIEQGLRLTAENLLKDNKDISYVSQITGLSTEKIKEISSKELITN